MTVNRTGIILITSLWILAILSVLAMGIGFRVSIEARLAKYNMDRLKALYLARAGVVKARELLLNDAKKGYDSLYECGISLDAQRDPEKTPESIFGAASNKLGDGSFSVYYVSKKDGGEGEETHYGMMDEERKININTIHPRILTGLLLENGVNDTDADVIAESIAAWRSAGPGIDDSYYESLIPPYKCKHANFSTIEELLLVKGMTQELFGKIKDDVTIYGDGRININTASKKVLLAVGVSEFMIDDFIINYRNGNDEEEGTGDDQFYVGVPDLGNNELINFFTMTSNYFRIESRGIIDRSKVGKNIVCIVNRNAGLNENPVKYYHED